MGDGEVMDWWSGEKWVFVVALRDHDGKSLKKLVTESLKTWERFAWAIKARFALE
jgi:hypothetical protein